MVGGLLCKRGDYVFHCKSSLSLNIEDVLFMKERDILHPGDQHPNGCSFVLAARRRRRENGCLASEPLEFTRIASPRADVFPWRKTQDGWGFVKGLLECQRRRCRKPFLKMSTEMDRSIMLTKDVQTPKRR
ncbi:hypothetical protein R3I93_016800 [Phoxinus phoxinus]|uniref:Uncharacterized protein n=1 Tax=Phoxinus phoxinus TaxID=58324 RepID=A0AAN9GWR7_9TELE